MRKIVVIETLDGKTMEFIPSGSAILENGVVTFTGMSTRTIRELERFGAVGLAEGGQLFPKDGAAFMDALVEETNRTSFVRACEVKE